MSTGSPGDPVVKRRLSPRSGTVAWNPTQKMYFVSRAINSDYNLENRRRVF